MSTKYAIRITEKNLDLIRMLSPIVDIDYPEDRDKYFVFTVDSPRTSTQHDVVEENDLYDNGGLLKEERTILL
jgi:hypothetical protein